MSNYVIVTDSSSDLSEELLGRYDIQSIPLAVTVEGQEPVPNNKVNTKEFYALLRSKKLPHGGHQHKSFDRNWLPLPAGSFQNLQVLPLRSVLFEEGTFEFQRPEWHGNMSTRSPQFVLLIRSS